MGFKQLGILALVMGMLVVMSAIGLAAEAVTWVQPVTSGTITGDTFYLNVTVTGGINVTNCSFYWKASDTNQTTNVLIGINNTGGNLTNLSYRVDADNYEDTSNGVINATCQSYGQSAFDAAATSIVMDSSKPTVPASVTPTTGTEFKNGSVVFQATTYNTTSGYVSFKGNNPGTSQYADNTETSNILQVSLSNVPDGIYEWQWVVTDGLNTTASQWYTFQMSGSVGAGKAVYYEGIGAAEEVQINKGFVAVIVAIIVLAIMIKRRKNK